MFQNQSARTEIRTQTSAHLAQTMTMLGMSSEEIREKIEGELAKNPFLELVEERVCPTCKRKLPENGNVPFAHSRSWNIPKKTLSSSHPGMNFLL